MQSINLNGDGHVLVEKPSLSDMEREKQPSSTTADQLEEQPRDHHPRLNRKAFFDEVNLLKKFQRYDGGKKGLADEKSQLQLSNYAQMLSDNKSQRLMNDHWLSSLMDNPVLQHLAVFKDGQSGVDMANTRTGSLKQKREVDEQRSYQSTLKAASSESSKEFCESIAKIIGETRKDYLEVYEKVLEKYISFFSGLSDILSALSKLITDGKDNKIKVNATELKTLLEKLKNNFTNETLYPTDSSKRVSETEASDWAEKLGLPSSCVQSDGNGGYVVKFDLSPIDEMIKGLDAVSNGDISSAKYQAWKAGFDAQVEKVNNYVQTLSQKYTTANSTYDNLVKVLAGTINAMYEADKEYLKN